MTSVNGQNVEIPSPVDLDFEQRSVDSAVRRRSPDVELRRHKGRCVSLAADVRGDVPDNHDDDGGRRRVSIKLDDQMKSPSAHEDDGEGGVKPGTEQDTTQLVEAEKPLSSGWAAALAAASAAGSVRAAAKRRTNVGRSNTFVPPPTRSLLCLSLTNPLRKLTISIVEWKYPFISNFLNRTLEFETELIKINFYRNTRYMQSRYMPLYPFVCMSVRLSVRFPVCLTLVTCVISSQPEYINAVTIDH